MARANRREYILSSNIVKAMFIGILIRARSKFDFTVVNICIMENHFHLMIRPADGESLSRVMQWILSCFAMRFNRHYGIHGHVWYDRFKSFVIGSLRQFQRTFAYISENPVRAGLAATAGEYKYNGLAFIRDGPWQIVDPPTELVRLLFPDFTSPQLLRPPSGVH
jgi:putative transposase